MRGGDDAACMFWSFYDASENKFIDYLDGFIKNER